MGGRSPECSRFLVRLSRTDLKCQPYSPRPLARCPMRSCLEMFSTRSRMTRSSRWTGSSSLSPNLGRRTVGLELVGTAFASSCMDDMRVLLLRVVLSAAVIAAVSCDVPAYAGASPTLVSAATPAGTAWPDPARQPKPDEAQLIVLALANHRVRGMIVFPSQID